MSIRPCRDDERRAIVAIVNAAAEAYRGVIPSDRWREPYMPLDELEREIAAGVAFWGYEADGALVGVMGVQPVPPSGRFASTAVTGSSRSAPSARRRCSRRTGRSPRGRSRPPSCSRSRRSTGPELR